MPPAPTSGSQASAGQPAPATVARPGQAFTADPVLLLAIVLVGIAAVGQLAGAMLQVFQDQTRSADTRLPDTLMAALALLGFFGCLGLAYLAWWICVILGLLAGALLAGLLVAAFAYGLGWMDPMVWRAVLGLPVDAFVLGVLFSRKQKFV